MVHNEQCQEQAIFEMNWHKRTAREIVPRAFFHAQAFQAQAFQVW